MYDQRQEFLSASSMVRNTTLGSFFSFAMILPFIMESRAYRRLSVLPRSAEKSNLCVHHGPGIDTPFPQLGLVGDQNPRQGRRYCRQGRSHSLQPPPAALKGISVADIENQTHESCVLVVGRTLMCVWPRDMVQQASGIQWRVNRCDGSFWLVGICSYMAAAKLLL